MKHIAPLVTVLGLATVGGFVLAKKPDTVAVQDAQFSAKTDITRAKGEARPWAHQLSDIKSDSKVVYGTLANGMRYVIYKNQLPPERVSLRLHVAAGSLNEAEDQRGVAHFLEHMVFNGTRHFPEASKLIPHMQRLGIAFGAHANAYTSFDETVYMLDLPNVDKDTVDLGFTVMGDFADGALLSDKEIDEERGVIAAEKTSRDSVQMRMMEKQFNALMPKSLLGKRFPIGTDEVIAKAPRERFVDFYTRFYTPEKMTFIVVGDIDVAAMEQRITSTFGPVKNPQKAGEQADVGDVSSEPGLKVNVFTDKELTTTDLSLLKISPEKAEVDSKKKRGEKLPLQVANDILNRRFARIAKEENAPITTGSASCSTVFRKLEFGSIEVTAAEGKWKEALAVLEQEKRRMSEFGVSQSEIDETVAALVNAYERQVQSAATRKTDAIASSLAQHIHTDSVYSTPEDDLAILQENLKSVTPESVKEAFQQYWANDDSSLIFSGPKADEGLVDELKVLYLASEKVAVKAPEVKDVVAFGYVDLGTPAKVVSTKHFEDLDIHQLALSNGVKLNFKKTDFDKDQISMVARFGAGKLSMPKDKAGLDTMSSMVFTEGGLGKHSTEELKRILAGRSYSVGFGVDEDSFVLSGGTTNKDLELQLQMLTAYLVDPGYRPEAERQFKAAIPMIYAQMQHTQNGAMAEMMGWLHGGDSRFVFPTMPQASALSMEAVKDWLTPQLRETPLEISVVGDFDPETLIATVCKTLGTLPQRPETMDLSDYDNDIELPKAPSAKEFNFDSKIDSGASLVIWKTEDATDRNIGKLRRYNLLSEVLSDRLRVTLREKLGEAYSPNASPNLSDTFKHVGFMMAYSPGKPENADKVADVIVGLGDELAEKGASADEFDRALKPQLGMLKKTLRQNSYWLGTVLDRSQHDPKRIEWARNRDADYQSITVDEINALAKKYLGKGNSIKVKIAPKAEK